LTNPVYLFVPNRMPCLNYVVERKNHWKMRLHIAYKDLRYINYNQNIGYRQYEPIFLFYNFFFYRDNVQKNKMLSPDLASFHL